MAMEMYKNVAERGSWARFFMQAGNQYKNVRFDWVSLILRIPVTIKNHRFSSNIGSKSIYGTENLILIIHEISINIYIFCWNNDYGSWPKTKIDSDWSIYLLELIQINLISLSLFEKSIHSFFLYGYFVKCRLLCLNRGEPYF